MKGRFNGIIFQVINMLDFPFDIQYLCITFKMAPVKQLYIRKGDWKVDSKIVGELLIGRGHDDELYM
jgi:hypothetical protein